MRYKLTAQEHSMGCGVACVASLLGISYKKSLRLFNKKYASTRGYYLKELALALSKKGLDYKYSKITDVTKKSLKIPGSIVFIRRSKKYPAGHYLLKTDKGWMNPWINYPKINPAKSGFQKKLPGEPQWVLYKTRK